MTKLPITLNYQAIYYRNQVSQVMVAQSAIKHDTL